MLYTSLLHPIFVLFDPSIVLGPFLFELSDREDAISPCVIQLASLVAQAMIRSWCLEGAVVIIKIKINAPAGVKMKQLTCKL